MIPLDDKLMEGLLRAADEAGDAIMQVYASGDIGLSVKDDDSPLTLADTRSHELITTSLSTLAPGVPVISEEGELPPYESRRGWDEFFLLDPLDGTKEFVGRNGEFTVNIALVRAGRPVLGVVYVPVRRLMYYARRGAGAWRVTKGSSPERIRVSAREPARGYVVAASRSHGSAELEKYLGRLDVAERVSRGSSLKFCLVAEGAADIYPRLGPTWEWDTAAGHAVLAEAGGGVVEPGGDELSYNKSSLKHVGFIAYGLDGQCPALPKEVL